MPINCGERDYLSVLFPVLTSREDSIHAWLGGDFLDSIPAYLPDSTVAYNINGLVPVLTQRESAINDSLGGTVLDPVPAFDSGEPAAIYLASLSPVILQWHTALEDSNGTDFLADPPVYAPDETPPVLDCPADTVIECADTNGVVVEFQATAVDECDPSPAVLCDPPPGAVFHIGETTVTCTATDFSGNSSECSFTVTVAGAEPPVINCPEDITAECTGDGGATVEFEVTAESACDTGVTVVCDPPSGSHFPLGETVVNCSATDGFGNLVECSFKLIVEDTTPPEITSIVVNPERLWPPDHKMVDVAVAVETSDCDVDPLCWIYEVTSNEPIYGRGDGNTEPDYLIIEDLRAQLRAERAGLNNGRVYTLHIRCQDAAGNVTGEMVDVVVPHDRGEVD
jgi:hypothetical protein